MKSPAMSVLLHRTIFLRCYISTNFSLQLFCDFATLVSSFCYDVSGDVSGEVPARLGLFSVSKTEPFFATMRLMKQKRDDFLLRSKQKEQK